MSVLHSGVVTDYNMAVAGPMDSAAISGLTVRDQLLVRINIFTVSGSANNIYLDDGTSGLCQGISVSGSNAFYASQVMLNKPGSGYAKVYQITLGNGQSQSEQPSTATWTGSWNLRLMATGGTSVQNTITWTVYKLLGQ